MFQYVRCFHYPLFYKDCDHNVDPAQQFPSPHVQRTTNYSISFFIKSIIYLWFAVSFPAGA